MVISKYWTCCLKIRLLTLSWSIFTLKHWELITGDWFCFCLSSFSISSVLEIFPFKQNSPILSDADDDDDLIDNSIESNNKKNKKKIKQKSSRNKENRLKNFGSVLAVFVIKSIITGNRKVERFNNFVPKKMSLIDRTFV